jgi:hypothetical protein
VRKILSSTMLPTLLTLGAVGVWFFHPPVRVSYREDHTPSRRCLAHHRSG